MPNSPADASAAGIEVRDVRASYGDALVLRGVSLQAEPGSSMSILGPSGCGKTTLLRVLAGLQPIESGQVLLGGRVANRNEPGGDPAIQLPPEARRVGMVFQDWALFPHLTVEQNVAYGLAPAYRPGRFRNRGRSARYISTMLEMVGIAELADRQPGSLSGGQQQRVALARALAPRPSILLLDEPFSSLDTSLRVEVRSEVAKLLRDLAITSVFVTHDQDEAFVLGDQVAVMRGGVVVQQDTPARLYGAPTDPWLADFVGEADFVDGHADGDAVRTEFGSLALVDAANGPVRVLVRPEELRLTGGGDQIVDRIEYFGHDTLYVVRSGDATLRVRANGAPGFVAGDAVSVGHSETPVRAFSR